MKTKFPLLFLTFSLLLSGCGGFALAAPAPTATATASPLPSPTATATATLTPTITPTLPPSATPTATWVSQGPDAIKVPILMYHHVELNPIDSNYRIAASKFEDQLRLLRNWGYESITTSMLVDAIQNGASLPPRPVIITFDDANEDNYTVAFPIMQKYGFTGVLYLPYYYIGTPNYLTVDQVKEMAAAGWEVGSHSLTHRDLNSLPTDQLRAEIVDSRKKLEDLLGVPILTFAYPFGYESGGVIDYVKFAGYIAAMGATGFTADQGKSNLFDLQRCEIKGSEDAKTFTRFLPWQGDPAFLPTDTPNPSAVPTRTPVPTGT